MSAPALKEIAGQLARLIAAAPEPARDQAPGSTVRVTRAGRVVTRDAAGRVVRVVERRRDGSVVKTVTRDAAGRIKEVIEETAP